MFKENFRGTGLFKVVKHIFFWEGIMEKNTSNIEKINNDLNNMLGSFIQRGLGKNKTYIIKKDASNVITNSTFINKEFSYKTFNFNGS